MTAISNSNTDTNAVASTQKTSYTGQDLAVFNLLQEPVWIFDIEKTRMFWANRKALEFWQADSLESLLGRNWEDVTEATRTKMDDDLVRLKKGEVIREQWTQYPNGVPTTAHLTATAISIEDGRTAVMVEARLEDTKHEENTVRSIQMLRQMPLPVFQYTTQGKLIYRNPEASQVYGDERNFEDLFLDKELGKKLLNSPEIEKGDSTHNIEAEHIVADGSSRWFSLSIKRARDPVKEEKEAYVLLMTARDITEVLKARQETAAANLKAEFLAVLAHDIRTPLHQIVGYADVLDSSPGLSAEQRDQVMHLQASATSLLGIVNDLLDYSKMEHGKLHIESKPLSLPNLLQGCLTAADREAQEKGLKVLGKYDATTLPQLILGDSNRLRRILLNLMENSIKYSWEGQIALKVYAHNETKNNDEMLHFEVSDTGIGIDPSQQKAVFEKYRQCNNGSKSSTRHYTGTGLGLAICQGLVQAMGGTIGLTSELGKGSTFYFCIPLRIPPAASSSHQSDPSLTIPANGGALMQSGNNGDEADLGSLRVLVVEDNKINIKVLRAMLQRLGHSVAVAENGQLALDQLDVDAEFDLVFMDVMMPVMGGIEATQAIRKKLGFTKEQLPIVGLTASFQHSDLGYYRDEVGMNHCIGKPVKLASLKRAIHKAVTGSTNDQVLNQGATQ